LPSENFFDPSRQKDQLDTTACVPLVCHLQYSFAACVRAQWRAQVFAHALGFINPLGRFYAMFTTSYVASKDDVGEARCSQRRCLFAQIFQDEFRMVAPSSMGTP
jgi:hypothetical protein